MAFAYYNRIAAINHARMFANTRDPRFADYSFNAGGGGDCTNFLSQNLYIGGWPMIDVPTAYNSPLFAMKYGGPWWAKPPRKDNSNSWASAEWFIWFLETSNRASPCRLGEVFPGDVITHEDGSHGKHVMLVTGLQINGPQRVPLLTYHTTDRIDYSFSDVMNGFGVEGYRYWKLKDIFETP